MSDKDQSKVSKEKENNYKKNNITKKWREKKLIHVKKESLFIAFFITVFLIDLIFVITIDFSIIDIIIDSDLCFSAKFSRSKLGIFTKIFFLGGIIGAILISLKHIFDFFSKND
ncbi:hypothetical protein [Kordia sp.]|uniref:hypothetical protein n=1 Tax=Kordia sp. TaxID=1965332 RepID=UPI003B5C6250